MTKPIVYIAETEDRTAFVKLIMEKYKDDLAKIQESTVLVKPNIVSREPYPTTTHPQLLASVLDFILECGNKIVVADGPAVDAGNSDQIITNHPLAEVCTQRGLELCNLHKYGFKKVKAKSVSLEISKLAFECNYIISLPVLKSHPNCYITGALKNQFGFLRNRERIIMHAGLKSLHKGIAEVNSILKPNLYIVDAIQTYKNANERRHGGIEAKLGYMLASKDPVALDSCGLELFKSIETGLIGMYPENIDYIAHALRLGLGSTEYDKELVLKRPKTMDKHGQVPQVFQS